MTKLRSLAITTLLFAFTAVSGGACGGQNSEALGEASEAVSAYFVQTAWAAPQQPLATVTVAFNSAQRAGDLNALAIGWNDTTQSITSVADSNGNTYQLAAATKRGNGLSQAIYFASNVKAGADTITVSFTGAAVYVDLRVVEYSGLSGAVDGAASGAGSGGTATSGVLNAGAGDLVFGAGMTSGTFGGPGAGLSLRAITQPDGDIVEDETVSTAGSYSATGPQNGEWVMQAVAFKVSAGGSDAGPTPDSGSDSGPTPDSGSDAGGPAPLLHISSNGRYLVDSNNQPFYLIGDTAWALPAGLTLPDATYYFQTRASQGFNLVLMDADIELGASPVGAPLRGPADAYGNLPFNSHLPSGDFDVSTVPAPGDTTSTAGKYWQNIDNIITAAAQNGIEVLLDVYDNYNSWFGAQGASPNSTAKLTAYGQFLGQRYARFDNIIWMLGNDYNESSGGDASLAAVIQGIRQYDTRHLGWATDQYGATFDNTGLKSYLKLNSVYEYSAGPWRSLYLSQYNRSDFGPTFNVESGYEYNASLGVTEADVRNEHYSFLLNGATGDVYGNENVWPFASSWRDWKAALTSEGGHEMSYFARLIHTIPWFKLVPDQTGQVFSGVGSPTDYSGAYVPDGTLALAYKPSTGTGSQSFTVNLGKFNGTVTATWFDPTSGTSASAGTVTNSGSHTFSSPSTNSAGQNDFVLVLKTNSPPDTTLPSVPSNVSATAASASAVNVRWTASTDNVGIGFYQLFRCQGAGCTPTTQVGTSTATSFADTGLTPSTTYGYAVAAVDTSGNVGTRSATANVTTSALPDGGAGDAAKFLQISAATPQQNQQTVTVTYPAAQGAGHVNLVVVGWNSATQSISSVTDANGNAYVVGAAAARSSTMSQAIYYARNVKAGANTVTVTFDAAVPFADIRIVEYGGLSAQATVVESASANGTSAVASAGPVATTGGGQLVFGAGITRGGFVQATGGYTTRIITSDGDIVQDLVPAASGSFTTSASVNDEWLMQILSIQ